MSECWLRQDEAKAYMAAIEDSVERVLVEASLCRTIGFLVVDPTYLEEHAVRPFDLLTHVRAVHALVKNKALLEDLLSGKYARLDDVPDLF